MGRRLYNNRSGGSYEPIRPVSKTVLLLDRLVAIPFCRLVGELILKNEGTSLSDTFQKDPQAMPLL